ncbi:Serine/threonine-protein phosphatase 2A activator 1 [Dispira simplex]|nr:Serine/threonine-protein phosphatase 2A activator 1 [Dispira simplex]
MSAPPLIPIVKVQDTAFREPVKVITTEKDIELWLHSEAFYYLMTFISQLNAGVRGLDNQTPCTISPLANRILDLLDTIDSFIDQFPPVQSTKQRYGNPAFRQFMAHLNQNVPLLHQTLLSEVFYPSIVELGHYLAGAFGNETRIDYGSGHELSFVVWLVGLRRLDLLTSRDHVTLVLRVFTKYLEVVRRLQLTYRLEPAGSHGVWGLDDYQFLPFLFGSAQFLGNTRYPSPAIITDTSLAPKLASQFMLMRCIEFIGQVKSGPFFEHSPLLHDISGVAKWEKVNIGLQKMYVGNVLSKIPIMQHLYFGSLIPFTPHQSL